MEDAANTIPTDEPAPWANGEFKFRNQSQQALLTLARELSGAERGHWTDIWLREKEPGQFCLCFMYDLGSFDKEAYDKFVYKMTDRLKREFGNDFIGWSISSKMWVIK